MPSPTVGAVPPPPGVTPNLQRSPDAGWTTILVGSTVCVAVVFFAFLLRCYANCVPPIRSTTVFFPLSHSPVEILQNAQKRFDLWAVSDKWLQWLYIQSLLYGPTVFSTKATLLFLTSRVCSVQRTVSKGIHFFIYFLFISYIPLQVIKTIICLPVGAYWDPELRDDPAKDVKCLNQGDIFVADTCAAVVTDTAITVIPIALVWTMRMPLHRKVRAGGVVVAVTAYRLPLLYRLERSRDVPAGFVDIGLLCSLEQTIGFVCACLPILNLLKFRCTSPRRSRLMANIPRTFRHRGKHSDGRSFTKKPPSSFVGRYMGNAAAHGVDPRRTGGAESEGAFLTRETRRTIRDGSLKQSPPTDEETAGHPLRAPPKESGTSRFLPDRTVRIADWRF
ncbi:hypothetical protein PG994_004481 [Apiospora phragmitis]|uniref:Rhodopsin domain-containing protein n=1 Tax=Apiospora phragmitis TaxID=2905665 RepID=A0ABR1VRW1_9PEZI